MKTYQEVLAEIRGKVSVSSTGKKKKTFSRSDWDELTKAYLNDFTASVESCKKSGDSVNKTEIKPVEEFRKMIKKILLDFGVDAQEASTVLTDYKITNVSGMYEICSTLITNYLSADKKFDFITEKDFMGSLVMNDVAKTTKTHKGIKRPDGEQYPDVTIITDAHRVVKSKTKAPDWTKKKKK